MECYTNARYYQDHDSTDFPRTINRFSPKKSLKAHFSKYGPWASSKCITWELVINAGFGLHL